jgi:hypothetical protein
MMPLRAGSSPPSHGGRATTTLRSHATPMQTFGDAGVPITPAPRDGGVGGGGTRDAGIAGAPDAGAGVGARDAGVGGTAPRGDGGVR